MGLTLVFSEIQVLLSHLWEKEGEKKKKGRKEKGIEKEKKEVRKNELEMIGGKKRRRKFNKN